MPLLQLEVTKRGRNISPIGGRASSMGHLGQQLWHGMPHNVDHLGRKALHRSIWSMAFNIELDDFSIWVWVNTYRYIFSGLFTSIYQLFWGSLGTRVLTHPHIFHDLPRSPMARIQASLGFGSVQLQVWMTASRDKRHVASCRWTDEATKG